MNPSRVHPLILAAMLLLPSLLVSDGAQRGEVLFRNALKLEQGADYLNAAEAYAGARAQLEKEGRADLVGRCRDAATRLEVIRMTYSLTEEQVLATIKEKYPDLPKARVDAVLKEGRLPQLLIGGKTYYFDGFLNTLAHLYPDFNSGQEPGALGKATKLFEVMSPYIYDRAPWPPGRTLAHPLRYEARGELTLPRKAFPAKGTLKVWLPLPLTTAAQPSVENLSIQPERYLKYPIRLDGDIGLAYMEIPLEEVAGDLEIGVRFILTHHAERHAVDPAEVGEYDRESPLYRRYTASGPNVAVTPAIRATAERIAQGETNPFLIAKKFYHHVVYDLDYSFMPHGALAALGIPESVYVHEHGYGDCGAQSMYFAALCRAAGIPARASGGMQLFPIAENGCNDHFWAQFYLPNYGWIPADTSAGQLARYMPGLTEVQRKDFIGFFFGNMDPFRYLIQVDVDIPLVPAPDELLVFPMVLQSPTALCREMDQNPGILFMENWKMTIKQIGEAKPQ